MKLLNLYQIIVKLPIIPISQRFSTIIFAIFQENKTANCLPLPQTDLRMNMFSLFLAPFRDFQCEPIIENLSGAVADQSRPGHPKK